MRSYWIMKLSLVVLFVGMHSADAQVSKNIRVNAELVSDLQQAADNLNLYGAVIIADSILIEDDFQLNRLSLFLVCHYLKSSDKSITLYPYGKDTVTYGVNGKGLDGSNVTIYSTTPVKSSFTLNGGDGKSGENGRDGKSGQRPVRPGDCCNHLHKGKSGGDGENGFDGGNGGRLLLSTIVKKDSSEITLAANGGKGGAGGKEGKGGISYGKKATRPVGRVDSRRPGSGQNDNEDLLYRITREKNGKPGKSGKNGKATNNLEFKQITPQDFLKELKKYGVDSLGIEQAAFTTLISLKSRLVSPLYNSGPLIPTDRRTVN